MKRKFVLFSIILIMLSNMLPVFGNGVEMTSYPLDNVSGSELLYTYELKIKGDILEKEWDMLSFVSADGSTVCGTKLVDEKIVALTPNGGTDDIHIWMKPEQAYRVGVEINLDKNTADYYILADNGDYTESRGTELLANKAPVKLQYEESELYEISNVSVKEKSYKTYGEFMDYFCKDDVKIDRLENIKAKMDSDDLILCVDSSYVVTKDLRRKLNMENRSSMPELDGVNIKVPLRDVAEIMNAVVGYNSKDNSITVDYNGKKASLNTYGKECYIDGEKYVLPVESTVEHGVTKVSANFFELLFDKKIVKCGPMFAFTDKESIFDEFSDNENDKLLKSFGIYVAVGSKSGTGTKASPMNTLNSAMSKVTALKKGDGIPEGGISIYLRSGKYSVDKTIKIDGAMSGTYSSPVSFEAFKDENVSFTGAVSIDGSKFKNISDERIKKRLDENARDGVMVLDLKRAGINNPYGPAYIRQNDEITKPTTPIMWVNDTMQTLARWPNVGYANTGFVVKNQMAPGAKFIASDSPIENWGKADDAMLAGNLKWAWSADIVNVSFDAKTKEITLDDRTSYGVSINKPYYICNLLEEIDMFGEWFIDRENLKLYYYPEDKNELKTASIDIACQMSDTLMSVKDAQYITFSGIDFQKSGFRGIDISKSNNIRIVDADFSGLGSSAINMTDEVSYTTVSACNFSELQAGCIYLNGGDVDTLNPSGNVIDNCYFTDFNRYTTQARAIYITGGVGHVIRNNEFAGAAKQIIAGIGNNSLVENNEFYDGVLESHDAGAIYAGRSWVIRNNVINNNVFHGMKGNINQGVYSIYWDDGLFGQIMTNNLFYDNLTTKDVSSHKRETVFEGNVFINKDETVTKTALPDWGALPDNVRMVDGVLYSGDAPAVSSDGRGPAVLYTTLDRAPIHNTFWRTAYPTLHTLLEEEYITATKYAKIRKNIFFNAVMTADMKGNDYFANDYYYFDLFENVIEDNINTSDKTIFADYKNDNYKIVKDVGIEGFVGPDVDKMGVYLSRERKTMPKIKDFDLITPANGSTEIEANNIEFYWEKPVGTNFAILQIATDPEFKNIVYEEKVKTNSGTVYKGDELDYGCTQYYWKVIAYNDAMKRHDRKESSKVYSFTTKQKATLNLEELKSAIDEYELEMSNTQVGTQPGNVSEETMNKFKGIIENAKVVLNDPDITKNMLDETMVSITEGFKGFEKAMVVGKVDLISRLNSLDPEWKTTDVNNIYQVNGGGFTFKPTTNTHSTVATVLGYGKQQPNWIVWTFKAIFNPDDVLGTWNGINLRATGPCEVAWTGTQNYIFIVKESVIELQSFATNEKLYLTVPNTYITPGKVHNIEVAANDLEGGGVRLLFKVDGQTVFDYNHTEVGNFVDQKGYLSLVGTQDSPITILPSDSTGDISSNAGEKLEMDDEVEMEE